MLIIFNYKDGEKCVDFKDVQTFFEQKKENTDKPNDYQRVFAFSCFW